VVLLGSCPCSPKPTAASLHQIMLRLRIAIGIGAGRCLGEIVPEPVPLRGQGDD